MLDNVREWISDNLRYILLGLAALLVLIIVVCILRLTLGSSGKKQEGTNAPVAVQTEAAAKEQDNAPADAAGDAAQDTQEKQTDAPASTPATEAAAQAPAVANSAQLIQDDAAVLTVVREYYDALMVKDSEALSALVDPWNDQVERETLDQDVIESYNNISTYSKTGKNEGDTVAFTYYEAKLPNVDTLSPTLAVLYLRQNEAGELKVYPYRVVDQEIEDYVTLICKDEDVQNLMTDIQNRYSAAVASDQKLRDYVSSQDTAAPSDNSSDEAQPSSESVAAGDQMTAIADLNIREQPSTDAAIMGVLATGEYVTIVGQAEDGWVQISYDGGGYTIDGYVKAEFLTEGGAEGEV